MHATTAHSNPKMAHCIEQCLACYRECLHTLTHHCLEAGGKHLEPDHVRLMMDCVEICRTSADFMIRGSQRHRLTCGICAEICRQCAEDCARIGDMDSCVEACRHCAESCAAMAASH